MNISKKLVTVGLCVGLLGANAQTECSWKKAGVVALVTAATSVGLAKWFAVKEDAQSAKGQEWNDFVDSCLLFYKDNRGLINGKLSLNKLFLKKINRFYNKKNRKAIGKDALAIACRKTMERAILSGKVPIPADAKNLEKCIPNIKDTKSFKLVKVGSDSVKRYHATNYDKTKKNNKENGFRILRNKKAQLAQYRASRTRFKTLKYVFGGTAFATASAGIYSLCRWISG